MASAPLNQSSPIPSSLHFVPPEYVWPESMRPMRLHCIKNQPEVAVIDLADLEGPSRATIVKNIGLACREWGFFQVVNHGVASDLAQEAFNVARQFFMLPLGEKLTYASDFYSGAQACIKYSTSFNPAIDQVLSWREFLKHQSNPLEEFIASWPDNPPSYREVVSKYCLEVRSLGLRLLSAISESLGVDPDFIAKAFDDPNSTQYCILNCYPPCPNPELALGFAAHSDGNGLTVLLLDDVPGLQIRHDGEWIDVTPIKDAFVINIADQIEILTNGRYKSVEHRALVNSTRQRMSIATALGPSLESIIGPATEFSAENNPSKYQSIKYWDYMKRLYTKSLNGKAMVESLKISH